MQSEHKSTVLLGYHLKQLKLPTILKEYSQLAQICSQDNKLLKAFSDEVNENQQLKESLAEAILEVQRYKKSLGI